MRHRHLGAKNVIQDLNEDVKRGQTSMSRHRFGDVCDSFLVIFLFLVYASEWYVYSFPRGEVYISPVNYQVFYNHYSDSFRSSFVSYCTALLHPVLNITASFSLSLKFPPITKSSEAL